MASKYIKKFKVPNNFENILSDFAKEILRNQPKDIIEFGIEYFKGLETNTKLDYKDKGENRPENYKRPENQEPNIISAPNKLEISQGDQNRLQRSMDKIDRINKEPVPVPEKEKGKKEEKKDEEINTKSEVELGRHVSKYIHEEEKETDEVKKILREEVYVKKEETVIKNGEVIKKETTEERYVKGNDQNGQNILPEKSEEEKTVIKKQEEPKTKGRYGGVVGDNEEHKKEYDDWFTKHSIDKQVIDYKPEEKKDENFERNEIGYKTWFNNHSERSIDQNQSGEIEKEKEEKNEKKISMEYRYLGNSGLRVSALGWGSMMMGSDKHENNVNAIKTLFSHGINFFDSAEIYDLGKCESELGKAIKELKIPREKIVVTTKIFRNGMDPNDSFLSRKHILEGLQQSLKRLQMDYVDVIFCHRYDKNTPIEEICRAMNYIIEKGMAFYWGTSEWDADQIVLAQKICQKLKLIGPIVEQTQYNLLHRNRIEREYANLFKDFKLGITVWSPLFSGVLTGKYIDSTPDESRYKKHSDLNGYGLDYYFQNKKEIDEKLIKLRDLAKNKLNCNLAQLSIAWILANSDISTIILGSTKMSQVEDVLPAVKIYKKLDKNILKEIEEIMGNSSIGPWDYETFTLLKNRRNELLGVDYVAKPDFTK